MSSTTNYTAEVQRIVADLAAKETGVRPAKAEVKAVPKKKKPKRTPIELAGDTTFKKIWGGTSSSGIDHKGHVYTKKEWNKAIRNYIPEVNPNYIPPLDLMEKLWISHASGEHTWLTGPSGCGKSVGPQQYAAHINQPFIRIPCREDMESGDFLGQYVVKDGSMVWVDGLITLAVKYGAHLLLDEWTLLPAGITFTLQWLAEDDGMLVLTDLDDPKNKYIKPHPAFRMTLADNTKGQGDTKGMFAGTNIQNTAFIDRIHHIYEVTYPTNEAEIWKKLVPAAEDETISKVVDFTTLIREAHNKGTLSTITMSTRSGGALVKRLTYLLSHNLKENKAVSSVVKSTIIDKIDDTEEQSQVGAFVKAVWG